MSCIYCDFEGKCMNYDDNIEMPCVSNEGYCVCEDDPHPEDSCERYEGDEFSVYGDE